MRKSTDGHRQRSAALRFTRTAFNVDMLYSTTRSSPVALRHMLLIQIFQQRNRVLARDVRPRFEIRHRESPPFCAASDCRMCAITSAWKIKSVEMRISLPLLINVSRMADAFLSSSTASAVLKRGFAKSNFRLRQRFGFGVRYFRLDDPASETISPRKRTAVNFSKTGPANAASIPSRACDIGAPSAAGCFM